MIKIEARTLEEAYENAASSLECSVIELKIELIQAPCKGFLGLFKKNAIIVAVREVNSNTSSVAGELESKSETLKVESSTARKEKIQKQETTEKQKPPKKKINKVKEQPKKELKKPSTKEEAQERIKEKNKEQNFLNDTIMPASFVSTQDDDEYDDVSSYLADYDDIHDHCEDNGEDNICAIVDKVKEEVNALFDLTCFKINAVAVSGYDEETLLIEFTGEDAALLIGKEGYRYKALSYMLFNWINTKYQVQLRLEIAEFLRNQEEAVKKYLVGVFANVDKDGRAQTKILDGVLIQIALKELREKYPDKYVVIRSTRDGLKYIIVNDYHAN